MSSLRLTVFVYVSIRGTLAIRVDNGLHYNFDTHRQLYIDGGGRGRRDHIYDDDDDDDDKYGVDGIVEVDDDDVDDDDDNVDCQSDNGCLAAIRLTGLVGAC